jgi:hypothetical protein
MMYLVSRTPRHELRLSKSIRVTVVHAASKAEALRTAAQNDPAFSDENDSFNAAKAEPLKSSTTYTF